MPDLSDLPTRAGGVFATSDAVAIGLTTKTLTRLAAHGQVTRLCHGWWAKGTSTDALDRHRRLCVALTCDFEGRAWVSHTSALAVARLPVAASADPTYVLHSCVGADLDRTARLATAIVQSALVAAPLRALYAADAALRSRLVTCDDLGMAQDRLAGQRGMAQARAFLRHADGRHESPGETRTAVVLRLLGYRATPQVELRRDGQSYWVDFLLDDAPVAIEFDGRVKYTDPTVLFAEKRREDEIRSWGYVVVRLTWNLLNEPDRVRRRLEDALALA